MEGESKEFTLETCGEDSPHFKEFADVEFSSYVGDLGRLQRMMAVFSAAREDFDGGYTSSLRSLVRAELFDSELDQARELLRNGYGTPAAVIAGTVLETALRELCDRNSVPHGKLDKMNADLAKTGAYNANQAKRITALAGIRNSAAHGKPDEFNDGDVEGMIEDIERFLAAHLN